MPVLSVLLLLLIGSVSTGSLVEAQVALDIQNHPKCKYCNMDRQHFAYSRMLVTYNDGTSFGACSLYCVAVDLAANLDKEPVSLLVADFGTHELIDAGAAFWVIGGRRLGVMTRRAKWAFKEKRDAETFTARNGGSRASLDEVIQLTYQGMYDDCRIIRGKRKIRRIHTSPLPAMVPPALGEEGKR